MWHLEFGPRESSDEELVLDALAADVLEARTDPEGRAHGFPGLDTQALAAHLENQALEASWEWEMAA